MKKVKQVIVMRNDLNMRKGKMVAQGSHASMSFLLKDNNWKEDPEVTSWTSGAFTKICLQIDSEEELLTLVTNAKSEGLRVHKIVDSGKTEFHGVPTLTCIAIGPNYSENIDKVTGDLKLL